jgi:Transmembrane domain of unknown function (DUF3566)
MNVTIKRIGVGSAFKIGAILNVILFAIFGLIGLGFQALFSSAISSAFRNSGADAYFDFATAGLPILCVGYLIGVVAAGIFGGIAAAIYALLYNLVSGMIGGLQVELSRDNP